jgi:hypothetical protein
MFVVAVVIGFELKLDLDLDLDLDSTPESESELVFIPKLELVLELELDSKSMSSLDLRREFEYVPAADPDINHEWEELSLDVSLNVGFITFIVIGPLSSVFIVMTYCCSINSIIPTTVTVETMIQIV